MRKRSLKKRSLFAAMLLMTSLVFTANAAESKVFAAESREISASTADELAFVTKSMQDGDVISIKDNITLSKKVVLNKSVTIDLNGHTLSIDNNGLLQCGYSSFDHKESYDEYHAGYWYEEKSTIEHPGYFYIDINGKEKWRSPWEEKVTTKKWHDPWTETKTKEIYNYHDEIKISIKNGSISHSAGRKNWRVGNANGIDGERPKATLEIISGTTYLSDIDIYGGKGGDGEDGKCNKWNSEVIGNGGNGSKGGDVFYIEQGNVALSNSSCHAFPGEGGKGGKGAVKITGGKTLKGKDGAKGSLGSISNKMDNVFFLDNIHFLP